MIRGRFSVQAPGAVIEKGSREIPFTEWRYVESTKPGMRSVGQIGSAAM